MWIAQNLTQHKAHAEEFNASGYDSSDKVDQPTHPVIFTKRATSIIADGDEIFPHPGFTESPDYEGEIGVIIGKPGFQITQEKAMDHVWGYTIINDMTARERQRDHKQFYLGKSPDTFCPMGPVAIAKEHLPEVLRVQTFINGEPRQDSTTKDLIFSIPHLVMALSEGQTLQTGDTLATGTPAGVGFGFKPPVWLKTGDEVRISVTGLGSLTNKIGSPKSTNPIVQQVQSTSYIPQANSERTFGGGRLTNVAGKKLFYQVWGSGRPTICIHGLGATSDYYQPLVNALSDSALHVFDFEGHGLSPTSASSTLSISSLATDTAGIASLAGAKELTVIAHSMGCLVALKFAIDHPDMVKNLILMGPPPSPLPEAGSQASYGRAKLVREKAMAGVVNAVVTAGTSEKTKSANPMAVTAVRLSLLSQDAEGYAKASCALAASKDLSLQLEKVQARTLIITGSEDKISPPELCKKMRSRIPHCEEVEVLSEVGHWHMFEDVEGVSARVGKFLSV
jgi:2-keto-4-pentenoate hydratase/2-oxohepta-3-ene-1,7-dioic acid hydratase in catechol pathway/pimeloyl-ACP methyl ester carboxylesterase